MLSYLLLVSSSLALATSARVARDDSYGAPEPSYHEPADEYAPVQEGYTAPAYTGEGEVIDIGSLILPMLVIVALFLLFPNYINLTTVRRSFKGDGPMEIIDQVRDVAQAILEDKDILTKYD